MARYTDIQITVYTGTIHTFNHHVKKLLVGRGVMVIALPPEILDFEWSYEYIITVVCLFIVFCGFI